jgi:chromosome segregation ATPase
MTTENQLVVVQKENALQLFTTEKGLDPILQGVRQLIDGFKPDVTTKKGRDAIASIAHSVAKSKTYLDGIGKELVDKLKEQPKLVDAERKRIRDTLDAWKDEVRKPLTDWEDAEKAREAVHVANIQSFADLAQSGSTAAEIAGALAEIESRMLGDHCEEYLSKYVSAKDSAIAQLKQRYSAAVEFEAQQAELERLRKEAAEREQKEREERLMREAAENARRQAEQEAQRQRDEQQRIANEEKLAAERREMQLKLQAEQAERQRIEAEQRAAYELQQAEIRAKQAAEAERLRIEQQQAAEKAEADRQAANKQHRASVNREILAALVGAGFTEDQAKIVITMAAKNAAGRLVIQY